MTVRTAFLALIMTATMAHASPVDFSFKPGTDLAQVFETIGVMGKFNVLVLPGAGQLQTTYSARLVEPGEALHLVAAAHGLAVRKLQETETWVIGHEERIRDRFPAERESSIALRQAAPEEVARQLASRFTGPHALKISTDARTRRLFLRGDTADIAKAQELVRQLDEPMGAATVHFTLTAGAPGKQETLWKGAQQLVAGEVSKLKLKAPSKAANGWALGGIEGSFSVRLSPDDLVTLTAEVDVNAEGGGGAVQTLITSSVNGRSGQELVLGSHELGGERALTLSARVEIARNPATDPLDDALDSALQPPASTAPPAGPAPSAPAGPPPTSPSPSPAPGEPAEIDTEL